MAKKKVAKKEDSTLLDRVVAQSFELAAEVTPLMSRAEDICKSLEELTIKVPAEVGESGKFCCGYGKVDGRWQVYAACGGQFSDRERKAFSECPLTVKVRLAAMLPDLLVEIGKALSELRQSCTAAGIALAP